MGSEREVQNRDLWRRAQADVSPVEYWWSTVGRVSQRDMLALIFWLADPNRAVVLFVKTTYMSMRNDDCTHKNMYVKQAVFSCRVSLPHFSRKS